MIESLANTNQIWWRTFELASGFLQNLQIGPTKIQMVHLPREWQIAASRLDEGTTTNQMHHFVMELPVPALGAALSGSSIDSDITRHATIRTGSGFRLAPVMGDRPIVCRPLNQLFVLPGDHVELFVSTPVWVAVFLNGASDGEGIRIAEIPSVSLTDTWIGATTVEGELGYSALTKARLSYKDVTSKPHQATTGVVIRNLASEPLRLDRISLPAPFLHVYASPDGALCTEGIRFEHKEGGQFAELEIMNQPLGPTGTCSIVGQARRDAKAQTVVRAFSSFLSRREPSL